MDLILSDYPHHMGWWNVGGMTNLGVIISFVLIFVLIIGVILVLCIQRCMALKSDSKIAS